MQSCIKKISIYIVLIMSTLSCQLMDNQAVFKELSADKTGIDFVNQLTYNDSLTVLEFEYMFNGAGVALIDINNDGLQDIYFTGNMVSGKLYLNKGNMKFEDITQKAGVATSGWTYGVSVVDINQDGYKDIYICKGGNRKTPNSAMKNLFFINNKNNTFSEVATQMNLADDGYDIQAAFLDYDKDGDLDMYLLRNAFVNYNRNNARPKETQGKAASTDKLYRNDGAQENGVIHFTDVSEKEGITIEGFGLGISVCDLNQDNWPDLYVSNDFLTNDLVYINTHKNGKHLGFVNQAHESLRHTTYNGMGNDVADFNNDGLEDIAVVDMLPPDNKRWKLTMMGNRYDEFEQNIRLGYEPQYVRNTLQLNNGTDLDGNLSFSEIGALSGVHATEWSWAPLFADYDNDGLKDLFIANGYRQDVTNLDFIIYGKTTLFMGTPEANRQDRLRELSKFPGIQLHNYVFKNKGNLQFEDVSKQWGLTAETFSNGTAYGDLDNDGDLDLVVNNLDQTSKIFENQTNKIKPEHNWLRIKFEGAKPNRDGFGCKVWVWQNSQLQYQYFSPVRGYLSTVESFLHFGLSAEKVDSLKVLWPDGKSQIIQNPKTKQLLTLQYKNANLKLESSSQRHNKLFEKHENLGIEPLHTEDNFVDFKTQALLPHLHSQAGPALAVGDLNGDHLEDVFVGAAAEGKPSIYLQQANGKFVAKVFPVTNLADNMGSLFFDADGDHDLDLWISSGGVRPQHEGEAIYHSQLWMNDGKGNFAKNTTSLPSVYSSVSSVVASDFDHDGDLDLFVAGRVCPGEYPKTPRSYLLRNDSKNTQIKFTDITPSVSGLQRIGMVSSALWTDYNNDTWPDLMLVGEYMPITLFTNQHGKLVQSDAPSLEKSNGWWNSLTAGDFDHDGDIDYLVGNLGKNTQYHASKQEPVSVYGKDFDKNGLIDPIMTHFKDGEEQMVHARDDLNKQITAMRARFKDYTSYAEVPFKESFRKDELEDALALQAYHFESVYLENKGKDGFIMHELPLEAQFAPLFGMQTGDFNADGHLDVLAVGNSFATEVQTGRYDAMGGVLLLGNGKGQFKIDRHSVDIKGDNKALITIKLANQQPVWMISRNKQTPYFIHSKIKQTGVEISPNETFAIITDLQGKKYRQEFYWGNSYLSQSSRTLWLSKSIRSIEIFQNQTLSRKISPLL